MECKRNWCIVGDRVLLVPYNELHVNKYHQWMLDARLRELTASELLSLEQEYHMQQKWLHDDDNKILYNKKDQTETDAMIGDVNLFFTDNNNKKLAEIEVMIAESEARGRGLGYEAVQLMMYYGVTKLDVKIFQAKIGIENGASLHLFKDKLGFTEISRSDVFQEVTLHLQVEQQDYHANKLHWILYQDLSKHI